MSQNSVYIYSSLFYQTNTYHIIVSVVMWREFETSAPSGSLQLSLCFEQFLYISPRWTSSQVNPKSTLT